MAVIFPRYLLKNCAAALALGTLVWFPDTHAAQASYYDCEFKKTGATDAEEGVTPLVLRFMLNTKLQIAFRIDTPMARPVQIFVSGDDEFSLLDNGERSAILLVTVRSDGRSVYSRHILGDSLSVKGQSATRLGYQSEGWCHPARRDAAVPVKADGGIA